MQSVDAKPALAAVECRSLILPVFSPEGAKRAKQALTRQNAPIHLVAISQSAAKAFGQAETIRISDHPDGAAMLRAIGATFHYHSP